MKFDHDLRRMAPEKLGMDPAELGFVFGRPLTDAICLFGLKVMKEKNMFLPYPIQKSRHEWNIPERTRSQELSC